MKFWKFLAGFWVMAAVLTVAFWVLVGWVAIHFISKWW